MTAYDARPVDLIPAHYDNQGRSPRPVSSSLTAKKAGQLYKATAAQPEPDQARDKYDSVFSNSLFENDTEPSVHSQRSVTGSVKVNGFFSPATSQQQPYNLTPRSSYQAEQQEHRRESTPTRGSGLAARASVTRVSHENGGFSSSPRRHHSNSSQATEDTEVMAFSDQPAATAVSSRGVTPARNRLAVASTSVQNSYAAWESQFLHLIQSGKSEEAVRLTAAPGQMVRCYVKRSKALMSSKVVYQVFLEGDRDTFVLAARKRRKSKASSYVISLHQGDLKRDTNNCMAKLRANFVGTEYMLWGKQARASRQSSQHGHHGQGQQQQDSEGSSDESDDEHVAGGVKPEYSREDMCVNFLSTANKSHGGPRTMFATIPLPSAPGTVTDPGFQLDSLSHALDLARRRELPAYLERKLAMVTSKPPEWDEKLKAHTLDFQGRVTEASVKNFQLMKWDPQVGTASGPTTLLFGKRGKDVFALDFAFPFNLEQAFAIALCSMDTKLCYTI